MSRVTPLRRHSDARGHLVAVSGEAEVPFAIRRVFWIYGNAGGLSRAGHANAATTELIVSVAGSCHASLDGPDGRTEVILNRPDAALLVPPMTWLELSDFTPDCVLIVLADTEYEAEDSIASLDRFQVLTAR
ncbi:FdtA/QdtA family cupin domain-containing protein [Microbacterium deminutum]|uniref:FdtA/QdtA family cupin domain-containing protein n=1 Tax=Microbacterium deminutum TaxID=344164 RepID=A0ABP5BSW7_9MICO